MKREERHHLKENPVARFVIAAQDWLANNRRSIVTGVGVVLVIVLAGAGYYLSLIHISEPTRPY